MIIIGSRDEIQQHLDVWTANKNAVVVGILPVDDTGKAHIPNSLQSISVNRFEELPEKADVLDICVPIVERPAWIKRAATFRSSVVSPLPFAETEGEEYSVIETCQQKGVSLYPGNPFQFAPAFEGAQKQVKNGAIGKPGVLRLTAKEAHPGGDNEIFAVFGINIFAWVYATFGDVVRVTGKHIQTTSKRDDQVEYAVATLRLAYGAIVHVEFLWSGESTGSSFELAGSKGMLHYDSRESDPIHLEKFVDNGGSNATDMVLSQSVLARQMEHYSECIQSGTTPILTPDLVLRAMKVAKAASVSAEDGEPVSIEGGMGQ